MDLGSPVINDKTIIGMISYVPQNDTDFKAVMINMKIASPWLESMMGHVPRTFVENKKLYNIVYRRFKN